MQPLKILPQAVHTPSPGLLAAACQTIEGKTSPSFRRVISGRGCPADLTFQQLANAPGHVCSASQFADVKKIRPIRFDFRSSRSRSPISDMVIAQPPSYILTSLATERFHCNTVVIVSPSQVILASGKLSSIDLPLHSSQTDREPLNWVE